jgi:hypothetical protein
MTAHFATALKIEVIGNRSWMLIDDLVFYSGQYRGRFVAPAGFQTDLASVPRLVWNVFPKVGLHDKAAVIHDAGYANALTTYHDNPMACKRIFTVKSVADDLFREGMVAEGVHAVSRWFMYQAVKRFGTPEGHPLAMNRATAEAVML